MAEEAPPEGEPKKKSGLIPMIAALAVLTAAGGGGGWYIGILLAPKIAPDVAQKKEAAAKAAAEEAAKAKEKPAEASGGKKGEAPGLPKISTDANGVVQLEPITTNLAYPSENWVRLEVALVFKDKPDVKMAEDIHQDILAYMRTLSLQQIEGPRGFQYLRDDIQERVDLRSKGRVSKVVFRTFIIQ